jgi:hypothetical protein
MIPEKSPEIQVIKKILNRIFLNYSILCSGDTYSPGKTSTIGGLALNDSVRNGKRCDHYPKSPEQNTEYFAHIYVK